MAPRRRQITDQSEDVAFEAIDVDHEDVSQLHEEQLSEEADLLNHFGAVEDGVRMHFQVHKVRPNSKITDFCFEGTREDLPVTERIQREFGSGTYKIFIFKNSKLFRAPSLGVLAPKTPLLPPPPSADPNFSRLIDLLTEQAQQRNSRREMSIAEMATAAAAIATAVAPLLQMFRSTGNTSTKDFMDMLATAKELFGNDDREPKSIMDVASEVLPALFANANQQPVKALPNGMPQRAPGQAAETPPPDANTILVMQLRQALRMMITRAQANSPPELYADVLDDMLPDEMKAMLKMPNAFEALMQLEPAIGTYRPWFEQVLQSLANTPNEDEESLPPEYEGAGDTYVSERAAASVPVGYDAERRGGRSHNLESDAGANPPGQNIPGSQG